MDNLVKEANERLQAIIDDLLTIKEEYERKITANGKSINKQLALVKKYKEDFYSSKEKVEKMNADIAGFEKDYESLVNRFKDDELASILVNVNKEISAKIEERKRIIISDKKAMNSLVTKAEIVKEKLVKLTAEKNALELCYKKICDAYDFYDTSLSQIIEFSNDNAENLCSYFEEGFTDPIADIDEDIIEENIENGSIEEEPLEESNIENIVEESFDEDSEEDINDDNEFIEDVFDDDDDEDEEESDDQSEDEDENNEIKLIIEEKEENVEDENDIDEENAIEFTEEDFAPDEITENVIDLNKLNTETESEIEDIEVENDNIVVEDFEISNDDFSFIDDDFSDIINNDDLEDDNSLYEE